MKLTSNSTTSAADERELTKMRVEVAATCTKLCVSCHSVDTLWRLLMATAKLRNQDAIEAERAGLAA